MNALPHALIRINDAGNILYANMAAEHFFRISANVLTKRRLAEIVPFGSPLLALVDQVRARTAPINEYGVDLGTPVNGTNRVVDLQVTPIFEIPGDILIMLQERSAAKKMDQQLTYQGAARSVAGLGSMLAHEVRNPLSGIRGAAQLLEDVVEGEDQALARLIREEVDRICALVDRMENFGDMYRVEREPLNIHTILDHVKKLATSGFARHIRFKDDFDPSLPPILGNRDQLIQVFLNLVKNAAESIGKDASDGEIILKTAFRPGIRLSVPGSSEMVTLPLEFSVTDNGGGIASDLMPHLFDPFVSTKAMGSGLGLALVAKIVRDHDAVIECDSNQNRTRFRVLMARHSDI
ncbi:MAG: PAS domain-containing protein [Rhizobiales bacterium]|nr:PAS domain-containing protein [Hyphomicrobiales bacterium]